MKIIKVSEGIWLTNARYNRQRCVLCGDKIVRGTVNVMFHNYRDELILKKNLWLHLKCSEKVSSVIKKSVKKHFKTIVGESL